MQVEELDKAEELYRSIIDQTSGSTAVELYYKQLGTITHSQGQHRKAVHFYEKALDIRQMTLSTDHLHLLEVRDAVESLRRRLSKKGRIRP